ncbi:MAG: DUF3305 domain-containing protein [Burkholderiaceae bacterium]|nr:DUF3305 domain-containing protein [Burkholderiaceae bacterium]
MQTRPSLQLAVVMQRERQPNRWENWRHSLAEVVADEPLFGSAPRLLHEEGGVARFLHPGFTVELFRDEGEGYHLNLTSGAPVFFVMWRIDDEDPSVATPQNVSLSYNEAGRWLDAQERVDNVPLPEDVRAWLAAYTEANYSPEVKQRRRPQSFRAPGERGAP